MKEPLFIIVGHYGSGKSEFSVNFARKLSRDKKVCLADVDVINTYFRSRETRDSLTALGIEVISDTLDSTKGLDMPYLSPAIKGRIAMRDKTLIIDCGGDPTGIRVLKQFTDDIKDTAYQMWMMVNVFRPETSNSSQIVKMMSDLELESGLKINGIINNSNFLRSTTIEDIVASNEILNEVVSRSLINVLYVCGSEELLQQLPTHILGEHFPLQLSLREKWL